MTITLAKNETKLLLDAAARGGTLQLPDSMKPVTRDRTLGRLEAEGLIVPGGQDGADPKLSPAGYRAVGLRPPRRRNVGTAAVAERPAMRAGERAGLGEREVDAVPATGTKRMLVTEMLGRPDGASLDELIAATGWLPHTTRAALSRIRSAGRALAKSKRPDGRTAYRLDPGPGAAVTGTVPARRGRRAAPAEAAVAL